MRIDIEFYYEDEMYCAFIGSDGGSGITAEGSTPDELADNLSRYLADFAWKSNPENEDEDE